MVKYILVIMFLLASGHFGGFGLEQCALQIINIEQASYEIENGTLWRDEIFLDLHMFAINI